jgi:WD40 repeat protein
VYTVAAVPDGSKVAAWSARVADGDQERKRSTYEVFDANAKPLVSFADKGSKVNAATFSADLTLAAAGDEQGVVRVFDLAKKERLKGDWPLFANPVGDLGLTPDKRLLVAIDRNGLVKVADADRRETLTSVPAHKAGVRGLLVSPKGDTFVTLGLDREVKAWSLADPKAVKEVRSWRLPVGLNGAAYAPDGKGLVTANADGTAYVLELP